MTSYSNRGGAMTSWHELLVQSRQMLLQTCIRILARFLKQDVIEKPTISKNMSYRLQKNPLSASWCLTWQQHIIPIAFHVQKHWYSLYDNACSSKVPEGTIVVRAVLEGAPRFAQIRGGSPSCLHTPPDTADSNKDKDVRTRVLEARLCGKPGSVFHYEFPKGVEIGHLLRLPTFAKVSDILPSILMTLSTVQARVMYEDPQQLYIYILFDDTFDEVTLDCNDVLVV